MVEQIEPLRPQLELLAFAYTEVLLQRKIKIRETRPVERVATSVPDTPGARRRELRGRKRMGWIIVVEHNRATYVGPVGKLIEPAEILSRVGKDGEREPRVPSGNTAQVPAAQDLLHHSVGITHEHSSLPERQFVQVRSNQLMADVKSRRAVIGLRVSRICKGSEFAVDLA